VTVFYLGSLRIEIGISGTYDRNRIEQTSVHMNKGKPAGATAPFEGQGTSLKPPQ